MKRRAFIRQLETEGCVLTRSSGGHDLYHNPLTKRSAPVPRHTEIRNTLCKEIRKQLGLPQ
ncbi:MAG: type II toxin-antitoxin system HicA family toxin [Nitrospira sp. CG24E]|nr:MAG: type II toxin-antitoxin system HicA family toxin [Nitrospira sp. CG24E]